MACWRNSAGSLQKSAISRISERKPYLSTIAAAATRLLECCEPDEAPNNTIDAALRLGLAPRSSPERKLAQYAMEREKQWRHGRTPDQISARLPNIRRVADHTFPGEQFHARNGPTNAITLSRREWLWSAKRA
jgi:hypothetical protein